MASSSSWQTYLMGIGLCPLPILRLADLRQV